MRSALPLFGLIAALLLPSGAAAHPGAGIVVDRQGTVYFVVYGTNRIMRITRNHAASVLVDDERLRLPHHLVLLPDGSLLAAADLNGTVWRVAPDGSIREYFSSRDLSPSAPGLASFLVGHWGDPFTADSAGVLYAVRTVAEPELVRVSLDSRVVRLALNARFGSLHGSAMAWGPDGALYLSDNRRIWRVSGDSATAITPRGGHLELAMGLALDSAGNLYVADHRQRQVLRLASDGTVSTPRAIESLRLFGPTGVAVHEGEVYVLDGGPSGIAVWRIADDGPVRIYRGRSRAFLLASAVLLLVPALLVVKTWRRAATSGWDWLSWTLVVGVLVVGVLWIGLRGFVLAEGTYLLLLAFLISAWHSHPARRAEAAAAGGSVRDEMPVS